MLLSEAKINSTHYMATSLRQADLPNSAETGQRCWGRCINTTSLLFHKSLGFALISMDLGLLNSLGVVNYPQFLVGTIAIILLPGPNSLYVLATAAKRGVALGLMAALGVLIGDTILMFAAATGATTLLKSFPIAYLTLKTVGAAYLAWIGIGLIRAGVGKWRARSHSVKLKQSGDEHTQLHQVHPTKAALGLSLTNPKAIFFFISFFTQFVDANAVSPALSFLVLGITLQIISLIYLSGLIVMGATLSRAFHEKPAFASIGMMLVGLLFVGFGARLLLI